MPTESPTSRCLHCGRPITNATFREMGAWEPDYDPADDRRTWRHADGYAACMGTTFATPRPEIVTLCGSTKFKDEFTAEQRRLGLEGIIVISVSMFGHAGDLTPEQTADGHPTKTALDELHKRKIDVSDGIHVINVGGYIGTSTRSEIDYAIAHDKAITYLEAT